MNPINWHSCFFLLTALLACAFAIAVVVSGHIVRMACFLVAALGAVAGLFFLAGADFLGAVQLMVYVGGTMVLLVFGVMLTARGPKDVLTIGGGQWIVAILVAGALLAVLLQAATGVPGQLADAAAKPNASAADAAPTAWPLGLGLMGVRADKLDQPDAVLRGGMSGYLLAFEIVSIHLVVVLIGAAYLARARRRVDSRHRPPEDNAA
ncbi:MAG: NADH-quinone oxidoreductase subunit J [Planctomycetaceae bacterium]|nr:NADH-quinone oxidoreductase subunit J [Planctomycetaceae bacterium]